jgi:hypothetical protein
MALVNKVIFLEKNTTFFSKQTAVKINKKSSKGILEKVKAEPHSASKKTNLGLEGIVNYLCVQSPVFPYVKNIFWQGYACYF